jgi:hypothetical protein
MRSGLLVVPYLLNVGSAAADASPRHLDPQSKGNAIRIAQFLVVLPPYVAFLSQTLRVSDRADDLIHKTTARLTLSTL